MNEKNMSVLDAFLALEDLEDEEVKAPLKEGKGFNVRDDVEMDKAKDFIEHQEKKEPELEVIDVDADSIEHLKNNEEYVGQIVLQCNSCKANRFIKAEDLVQSETDDDVYNIEDECPHCHGKGNGYTLKGQVGKYESEEEVKAENDSLTDEPKFDNDFEEEQPAEEEPQEEEQPAEPISFEEPEDNGMETTAEDDTADMKSTLGDEFDSNDVEWDDTEEKPEAPAEEDSLTNDDEDKYEEPLSPIEEPKEDEDKKKEEDLEEDVETDDQIVSDFTETIIEPENIENVLVFDLDGEDEEQIFEGKFEDLPPDVLNAEFIGFDVGQGTLIINIDSDSEIDELTPTVATMLNKFTDDFNENISVWDQATGDEVFQGTKQSVLEEYGSEAFLSFEAPERLELKVRNVSLTDSLKTPYQEDLDFANPEEKLISNIIKENKLREYRVDKFGSEEYWIAESIKQREDLNHIFENYIKTKSNKLVLEFKDVTGYKDKFDLLNEEAESLTEDLEDEVREEAKKHFEDSEVESVIYGYESRGKFHRLQGDLLEIRNDRELRMATELVKAKYHPTGSVRVLYRDSVQESVDCKNRKELTEAILDCESKGIAYTIKRAVKEGYRYTLIKEEAERGFFDDEEPIESTSNADKDIEVADAILRLTNDIADTFNAKGAVTDKRLIAADILNDLEIITAEQSDKVKTVDPAENLRDVVIEVLTGLHDKIDEYASSEDEEQQQWAEECKDNFEKLNGEDYTKEAVEARFQDVTPETASSIPGVVFPEAETEAETECLREGVIYISADESNLTDDQINKALDLSDAGLKERQPIALEGEEDLFVVANKGKNYLGHRKDIDNYLNNFRNEPANEAISRDEFLKNHPQASASDKVEDHLEDCLKEAENRIDTDFYPEGHEFDIDITDIFTEVLKGKVKFNFDVLKAVAQYLMEKLPGMYDYLDFEVESSPKTLRIKYKLKPTNESLNESEEDGECKKTFRILTDDGMVFEIDACSEEEARKEFEEVGYDENTGWPNQRVKQHIKDIKLKEALGEEHTISFNAKKFCENENEYKELTDKIKNICGMKSQDSWEDDDEVWIKFDANEDEIKKISETTGIDVGFLKKSIDESLDEAKKDDELPADPEVVKTNVHAVLNNLVTDEIEAINGYEEAKAEIADTHIEHKDDIIDTIDHIEDEEQEHIDELIDAASEIPFEKESQEEVKEEPIEEPEIEEEPEVEPLEDKPFEESYHGDTAEIVDYFRKLEKYLTKNNINHRVENEKRFESIYLDDEKEPSITLGKNDNGSYYIWVGDKLIESPDELLDDEGETYSFYEFLQLAHKKDEETLDFDETKFESFINEWFNQNVEDTQVFEALKGNFTDDGTIILEGKLISEDKEQGVKFTLTPNKEMNEDLMDSKKVTTYTVTSTCLPEGLVLKESPFLWNFVTAHFNTRKEAEDYINKYIEDDRKEFYLTNDPRKNSLDIQLGIIEDNLKGGFNLTVYFWDLKNENSDEAEKVARVSLGIPEDGNFGREIQTFADAQEYAKNAEWPELKDEVLWNKYKEEGFRFFIRPVHMHYETDYYKDKFFNGEPIQCRLVDKNGKTVWTKDMDGDII